MIYTLTRAQRALLVCLRDTPEQTAWLVNAHKGRCVIVVPEDESGKRLRAARRLNEAETLMPLRRDGLVAEERTDERVDYTGRRYTDYSYTSARRLRLTAEGARQVPARG